ncbi:MAG TPA: hypothetical protein VIV60_26395 [Polyangiaceae bacterium]
MAIAVESTSVDIAREWSETSSNAHLSNLLAMRWNLSALPRGNQKGQHQGDPIGPRSDWLEIPNHSEDAEILSVAGDSLMDPDIAAPELQASEHRR